MKERPILFSGAMVRAILNGTKTQTRRVIKPQPSFLGAMGDPSAPFKTLDAGLHCRITCPYSEPGDGRLWVRETWMDLLGTGIERRTGDHGRYAYQADTPPGSYGDEARKDFGLKWRPSIHMPRAASRLLLEVVGVRVERLQDISAADAIAEGIERSGAGWQRFHVDPDAPEGQSFTRNPVLAYRGVWEQINGAGSWDANPWVWVLEFRRAA